MVAPAIIGGAIAAGGAILGGITGSTSAKSINKKQIKLAREQMEFQERMSSTAFQRSTVDLEAAGLNRILALGSPSSSPGGAQPPSLKVPGEHIQRGISSALQNANLGASIELMGAQANKTQNEADILAPKAEIYGEAGNLIDEIIVNIKKRGPDFLSQSARDLTRKPNVKLSETLRDRITSEANTLKKQIPGESPNFKPFEPSRQQESTYRERNTPRQNLDAWVIKYAQTHNSKPSAKAIAAYLKYLKGNSQ